MGLIKESEQVLSNTSVDMVTIIISAISLIISLILAIRSWWIERFKLDFEMVKWFGCKGAEENIFIWLYVTNYSKLPCSILEIIIKSERDGRVITCSGYGKGKLIAEYKEKTNEYTKSKEIYSLNYPVTIEAYTSIGGYFHVVSKADFYAYEENNVEITIRTSRGIKKKKIFMDYGKNIYRVLQNKDLPLDKRMHRSDGSNINYLDDSEL